MPAYNEERHVKKTISSWMPIVKSLPGSEILIVNDGSTDKTPNLLNALKNKSMILKVVHKKNEGHGKTIFLAYKRAYKTRHEWVFQTDSDGHFDPLDFYKLWKKRKFSKFILGVRHKRNDSTLRTALSRLISIWIYILFGVYIKDANVPFRLINKKYLGQLLKRVPEGIFAPNIFLSILAAKDGQKLHHIKLKPRPHAKKASSLTYTKLFKACFKGFVELAHFRLNFGREEIAQ